MPDWPTYNDIRQQYVRIGAAATVQCRPFAERRFWDELFPIDETTDATDAVA